MFPTMKTDNVAVQLSEKCMTKNSLIREKFNFRSIRDGFRGCLSTYHALIQTESVGVNAVRGGTPDDIAYLAGFFADSGAVASGPGKFRRRGQGPDGRRLQAGGHGIVARLRKTDRHQSHCRQ
jgi:hypothetical protein